ncbi:arylsulfatase A-like enzyme [Allocatelliglobosispora scoriae]|uniref:Arylsulfatase A-like enzyme n=1 Tax=Allocatelliglobosispora scoriae TaxID=643052 RepID=A0A841C4R5_9ACTN|nr:sulfatase [Allocatelliglobosispora scoriae]MBB5874133.1 arylsulfatase A-like enzyme [Allocatelliglobosispora scoriae]
MTDAKIDRRGILRGLGAAGLGAATGWAIGADAAEAATPPNVIVVLIDDLARRELGCYGNTFNETPHMDRLAADGTRFTAGYSAAPVCSPTRASLMTGQYPARVGITEFLGPAGDDFLPTSFQTLPETLRAAGYRTGLIGKWHLSETYTGPVRNRPGNPWSHGFTDVIASEQKYIAGGDYFHPYFMLPDLPQRLPNEYLTERLNLEAVDFIIAAHQQGVPFYLHLAHYATHATLAAPQPLIDKYAAKPGAGQPGRNPVLAAMLQVVDDGVGAIRATLDQLGIAGDTVILLLSDNGGDGAVAPSTPLRGAKATLYEGGVRVPMIAYHPAAPGGRVVDTPFSTVDVMPTLLDTAGVARPPGVHLDGVSFAGLLSGGAAPQRDTLFWVYPHWHNPGAPTASVRRGKHKLLRYLHDGRTELFDLVADPGETANLATSLPAKTQELQAALDAHLRDVDLFPPEPSPANLPVLVTEQEFDGGLGGLTVLAPAPEQRAGTVAAAGGALTVAAGGAPAFALLRSDIPATHTDVAVIVSQRSYAGAAATSQDTLFAGLVKDAANYFLVWYNHKLKRVGWDVRIAGVLTGERITQLDGKINYPGPNARLACVLHGDELTAYAVAANGWQYLFTADAGRYARLDDPAVRAQYRYGFGVRLDGGTITVERFAVRRR